MGEDVVEGDLGCPEGDVGEERVRVCVWMGEGC